MTYWQVIRLVLKDISTHANGDYDVGRVVGWIGALLYSLMGVAALAADIYQGRVFDFSAFGLGYGALATGTGALIWMKQGTENTTPKAAEAARD